MSLEEIPLALLGDGALASLLVLNVWMVLTGRLIPRRTHEEALAAASVWQQAAEEATAQVSALLEVGHTTSAVLRALPHPPPDRPEGPMKGRRRSLPGDGSGRHDEGETR